MHVQVRFCPRIVFFAGILLSMLACDDGEKGRGKAASEARETTKPVERKNALDANWIRLQPDDFAFRIAFPREVEPTYQQVTYENVTAMKAQWTARKGDSQYQIAVFEFSGEVPHLDDPRAFFEWQQGRFADAVEGEFEAAQYRESARQPSADLRFSSSKFGDGHVAFGRFVLVGKRLLELIVFTPRDSDAPVAPFMKSFVVSTPETTFAPAGCECRVEMPAVEPVVVELELPDGSRFEARRFLYNVPDRPIAHSLTFATIDAGKLLDFAPRKVMDSLARSIAKRVDGEVVDTANIKRYGRPGLEAAIAHEVREGKNALIRAQIFVSDSQIHIVEVAMLDTRFAESARVQNFFESVKLR